jgi:uncharacterized phage protein (TIGR02218 family)
MKTIPGPTLAHLQGETTNFALCWLIERRDGTIKGFTSNVDDLVWLDPVGPTNRTFKAATGAGVSNLQASTGRGIDNMTALGVISSPDITEADLLRGLYDDAKVQILLINHLDTTQYIVLLKGYLGEVKVGRKSFETEVRSLIQRASQTIGKVCSPLCRVKVLGDSECTVNLAAFTFTAQTVSTVVSRSKFKTASAGVVGKPAYYFAYGKLTWTSGANAGKSVEVRSHDTASPCQLTLAEIMPFDIVAGDQFTIIAGCDRLSSTCKNTFNNILNFRGEPFVPGSDSVLKITSV